jgi:hypothetical protein
MEVENTAIQSMLPEINPILYDCHCVHGPILNYLSMFENNNNLIGPICQYSLFLRHCVLALSNCHSLTFCFSLFSPYFLSSHSCSPLGSFFSFILSHPLHRLLKCDNEKNSICSITGGNIHSVLDHDRLDLFDF